MFLGYFYHTQVKELEKHPKVRPQQGFVMLQTAETRPEGDAAYAAKANSLFAFIFIDPVLLRVPQIKKHGSLMKGRHPCRNQYIPA